MRKVLIVCLLGCITLTSHSLSAQLVLISGQITDQSSERTLPGTAITIRGAQKSILADIDGKFTLTAEIGAFVSFTFVGYEPLEKEVLSEEGFWNISLKPKPIKLDEVVVIGYGTVDRADLTGSVIQVKSKDLPNTPSASLEPILQGKVAGLQIINSTGEPGSSVLIRLRGGSSSVDNNAPLVIVDGFPLDEAGFLRQIAPQDIASVEVLKDASTTAIYGTRASNGLILITTKKGQAGINELSVNVHSSVSNIITKKLPINTDPLVVATLANEAAANSPFSSIIPYSG